MNKILFIVDFSLSNKMAGPAMRYYELAKALSKNYNVTLAGIGVAPDFLPPKNVIVLNIPAFLTYQFILKFTIPNRNFLNEINKYNAIITHGRILSAFGLSKVKPKLIIDLYGPWFIEDLVSGKAKAHKPNMVQMKKLLLGGDYFICANKRQKDLYAGMMLMAGRSDSNLLDKIGIVPIGISSVPPENKIKRLKGVYPGINENDKLIISWGGMWDWLDPKSLLYAMNLLRKKRDDLKLVFFGAHNSGNLVSKSTKEAIKLAKELNLYNKQAFFFDQWIAYDKRGSYLKEADIGVISHNNNLETRYSWRTRALDLLWANLPIITTEGDPISELVQNYKLGKVVPQQNPKAFADSIFELIENSDEYSKIKENIKNFVPSLFWDNLTAPIEQFLKC